MADIEIKRGYEVLPDNNVRFGISVINNSDFAISDIEVIPDYSESLFNLEGSKVRKLDTIPPCSANSKIHAETDWLHPQRGDCSNNTLQRPSVEAAHAGDTPPGGASADDVRRRAGAKN